VHEGHVTDKQLVVALIKLFIGQTVVGLGDGPEEYRILILNSGKVPTYDAYDSAPNINDLQPATEAFDHFEACASTEVNAVITRAPSKSCEMDPIPTEVLKKFLPELLPYITDITSTRQLSTKSTPCCY